MKKVRDGEIEDVVDIEQPTIFTAVDIKNGASIPQNSFVEVQWRDATDNADVNINEVEPSDVLCVARTYGKFIKEDEGAVMIMISEFLDSQLSDHVMCVPKGWIEYVKILDRNQ